MEQLVGKNPEKNLETFDEWLKNLSENGQVDQVDPAVVGNVLEIHGANFEISESAHESLKKYSNKAKRPGLDEVWGKEKVDSFKSWVIGEYIPYIEKKVGRDMHTLYDRATDTFDDVKHSGMMQFLGELTSYAAGDMSFKKYKRITENRYSKGKKWEYGDRYEPYKPSRNSPFPVDFPVKAINRLKAIF